MNILINEYFNKTSLIKEYLQPNANQFRTNCGRDIAFFGRTLKL